MTENDVTGMQIYYYYVCKRKLWYFSNELTMESENKMLRLEKSLMKLPTKTKRNISLLITQLILIIFQNTDYCMKLRKAKK